MTAPVWQSSKSSPMLLNTQDMGLARRLLVHGLSVRQVALVRRIDCMVVSSLTLGVYSQIIFQGQRYPAPLMNLLNRLRIVDHNR
jgi:hypothetical protein